MDSLLIWSGTALEVVLLCRLVSWRAWRYLPWFCLFFAFLFIRLQAINYVHWAGYQTRSDYAFWYWITSTVAALLWFPVAWEVFRNLFSRYRRVFQTAGAVLAALLLGLGALSLQGTGPPLQGIPDMQRKAALVIASWMLLSLLVARYYHVTPSLNVWGIALGLGLYAATTLVNLSAWGIDEHFYPVFRYVRPVSFLLTLILWTWTLWIHTPNPEPPGGPPPENYLTQMYSFWSKIRDSLRRALGL